MRIVNLLSKICSGCVRQDFSFEKNLKKRDGSYNVNKTYDTITASDLKQLLSNVEKLQQDRSVRMNQLESAAEYFTGHPSSTQQSWLSANQSQIRKDFDICLSKPRENDKTYQDLLRSATSEFLRRSLRNSRQVTDNKVVKPFIDEILKKYDAPYYGIQADTLTRDLHYLLRLTNVQFFRGSVHENTHKKLEEV